MTDSLGDRMKAYERCSASTLVPNVPIVIRVDGKAFHTFTKRMGFDRPFDKCYMDAMVEAAINTGKEMQNFKAAYVQSDEASFLLYSDNPFAESWFGGKVQKLASVSAATMTNNFNVALSMKLLGTKFAPIDSHPLSIGHDFDPAIFDSRAFNVVKHDVPNLFLWRMKDWRRNSLQMFARSFFSHKELIGKNTDDMHAMLDNVGESWDDLDPVFRNGTLIFNDFGTITTNTDFEPTYPDVARLFSFLCITKGSMMPKIHI